jgi:polyhydroxyalkanoate synthase subunit PhaC
MDIQRRASGKWLDYAGLGPIETPSRTVLSRGLFTLKAYGENESHNPVVLIIPSPIKRPYIWDMLPEVSAVQRFLEENIQVYIINWERPGPDDESSGLDQYAGQFILDCLSAIEDETGQKQVFISGHSLGGTFAAIFSSLYPDNVKGLVLITTPLRFGPGGGDLANLTAFLPPAGFITLLQGNVPGTLLDVVSLIASPIVFGIGRWTDRVISISDREALRTHICVERWSLDETPIARRLFEDAMECLYRNDLFFRNRLLVGGRLASPKHVRAPVLGVIDKACTVVPPRSFMPVLEIMRSNEKKVLWYDGDRGVSIRHLGPLVGKRAHQRIWPEIVNWVKSMAN